MQIGLAQAKARLSELTSLVEAGEEVVIAKHGRPSCKLVLVSADDIKAAPRSLDSLKGLFSETRKMTRSPKGKTSFVANWRQESRY